MRVTSSPIARLDGPASSSDRSAPSGEPFRTALRAADTAGQPGPQPGASNDAPGGDPAGHADPSDDTMAPAAAQVSYLARLNAVPGAAPTGRTRTVSSAPITDRAALGATADPQLALPADPTSPGTSATGPAGRTRHATPADNLEAAAAALALGSIGAPPAAPTAAQTPPPDAAPIDDPIADAIAEAIHASGASGAPGPGAPGAPPLAASHDDAEGSSRKTAPPHLPEAALDPMTAATLRAAYGLPAEPAPARSASAPAPAAPLADSPVAAWTAAAIGRAISTLGGAAARAVPGADAQRPGPLEAPAASGVRLAQAPGLSAIAGGAAQAAANDDAAAPVAAASSPTAASALTSITAALTPLEQAVHELVGRFGAPESRTRGRSAQADADTDAGAGAIALPGLGAPSSAPAPDAAAPPSAAPTAHAAPASPAEPPANPSHVHLVIDDGPERVVATVALRGSEVHVALRATDDATAAALARNAASLDHAMHGRGLQLGELTAERDRGPRDHRPPQDGQPRERRPHDAERFELEEEP